PLFDSVAADRRTAVVEAVATARDAVVNIRTEQIVRRRSSPFFGFGDSIFDQFFNDMLQPRSYKTQSLGSGVIIDGRGYILTNAHVVEKASKIFVALPENNKELEATLIGMDNRIDLAVLKIEQQGPYPFLLPARSDDLLLGESVIAIGNPLGLGHSITTGIVSSTQRRIQIEENFSSVFIQTDALINPGNSGGPLININGELVGINTAIARQAQGIGFSIPINTAKRVLNDLIEYGRVRRAFLGVVPVDVSSSFTRSRGDGGVLIEELLVDSPAEKAGFEIADVILAIDGIPISTTGEYYSLLQTYTPDDKLRVSVLRGLQELEKSVLLTTLPEGYELSYALQTFGFGLKDGRNGVLVDRVINDSPADVVGLKQGDRIAKVDGVEIESLNDFETVIADRLGRLPLTFLVARNNRGYLIELP
ncbi:trypsin-like peptidase domain-containing protein, partial [Deltaproteobacteria bacterium]|nr:trypsin-like peptidase domain-containing protein [Deltaproteobacteria bacterium]